MFKIETNSVTNCLKGIKRNRVKENRSARCFLRATSNAPQSPQARPREQDLKHNRCPAQMEKKTTKHLTEVVVQKNNYIKIGAGACE